MEKAFNMFRGIVKNDLREKSNEKTLKENPQQLLKTIECLDFASRLNSVISNVKLQSMRLSRGYVNLRVICMEAIKRLEALEAIFTRLL